jgi:hypothetical protein
MRFSLRKTTRLPQQPGVWRRSDSRRGRTWYLRVTKSYLVDSAWIGRGRRSISSSLPVAKAFSARLLVTIVISILRRPSNEQTIDDGILSMRLSCYAYSQWVLSASWSKQHAETVTVFWDWYRGQRTCRGWVRLPWTDVASDPPPCPARALELPTITSWASDVVHQLLESLHLSLELCCQTDSMLSVCLAVIWFSEWLRCLTHRSPNEDSDGEDSDYKSQKSAADEIRVIKHDCFSFCEFYCMNRK